MKNKLGLIVLIVVVLGLVTLGVRADRAVSMAAHRPIQVLSAEEHCTAADHFELVGPEYDLVLATQGGPLVVGFMARHWNSALADAGYIAGWFDVLIDGESVAAIYQLDSLMVVSAHGALDNDTLLPLVIPVEAGEHTIQWVWKTNAGEWCIVRGLFMVAEVA